MHPVLKLSRWLRLLVLCLLIPAYGIAAAGVAGFVDDVATVEGLRVDGHRTDRAAVPFATSPDDRDQAVNAPGSTPGTASTPSATSSTKASTIAAADDIAALMLEHGDTSDDMSDHCLPHLTVAITPFVAVAAPAAAPTRSPDAPPGRLQRPPRG